jgi:hypothetical protein
MEKIFDVAAQLLVSQALLSQRLCAGRLMRPEEVASATNGGAPDPSIVQGWYLCGDLAPEMFATADFGRLKHLGRTLQAPSGCMYVVWAQQSGHWQHRFVLPLIGPEAMEYLAFVQAAPIRFSLADGNESTAVLVRGPDTLRSIVPPTLPVQPVPQDLVVLSAELLSVVVQMLDPQAIVDRQLQQVRFVCVSVVQTPSTVAALQAQAQAQRNAGARFH